jgi:hypothetical protein
VLAGRSAAPGHEKKNLLLQRPDIVYDKLGLAEWF